MTREEAHRILSNGLVNAPSEHEWCMAFNMAIQALSQEPCDDEYIKVPKKALKYRTAGMVAYNAEWLKNHFDIERAVICGAQDPCTDAVSREAVDEIKELMTDINGDIVYAVRMSDLRQLPSVNPQPCDDAISREAVIKLAYDMSEIDGEHFDKPCMVVDVEDIQKLPSVNPVPMLSIQITEREKYGRFN